MDVVGGIVQPLPKTKDKRGDSGSGKSQFNAMLSDLDSEMQKDYECFASLIDRSRIPLAIFSCSINGEYNYSCGDTGASCCISWKYAIRAGLKVQTTSTVSGRSNSRMANS
jgi:hypothetical protein